MNRFVKQGISLFTMLVLLSAMLASAAPVFAADEEYEPDPVVYSDKQTVSKNTPFEATFVFDHSNYSSSARVEEIEIDVSSVTSAISLGKRATQRIRTKSFGQTTPTLNCRLHPMTTAQQGWILAIS